jgi:hypothetical protein
MSLVSVKVHKHSYLVYTIDTVHTQNCLVQTIYSTLYTWNSLIQNTWNIISNMKIQTLWTVSKINYPVIYSNVVKKASIFMLCTFLIWNCMIKKWNIFMKQQKNVLLPGNSIYWYTWCIYYKNTGTIQNSAQISCSIWAMQRRGRVQLQLYSSLNINEVNIIIQKVHRQKVILWGLLYYMAVWTIKVWQ